MARVRGGSEETSTWECGECGWMGVELTKTEASEYHDRYHSKQGTKCACRDYEAAL